jgi:hypothetical protein
MRKNVTKLGVPCAMITICLVSLLNPQTIYGQAVSSAPTVQLSSTVRMLLAHGPVNNNNNTGNGIGQFDNRTCSFSGDPAANINLRCDNQFHPFAETAIAADPTNPDHLLVGANDNIVLGVGPGFTFHNVIGFFVSFDGGTTWTSGQIPASAGGAADPAPAFNTRFGTAHMAHVGVDCSSFSCTFSAQVSTSQDGGLSWGNPVKVASGMGRLYVSETAVVNDKPWIVADNNPSSRYYGRLYLTWSRFFLPAGPYFEDPIYFSYSDDGGRKWSPGVEISGSSSVYCNSTGQAPGHRCADDQFSTPVVLPNGTVVVHFMNWDHVAAWEAAKEGDSQTMVVRSTDGGTTWSDPIHIVDLEDSTAFPPGYPLPHLGDYPISDAGGVSTLTGHEFTVWSVQEMIADPVTGNLYAFVTDNRDGVHDSFSPVTESNVFMTKSTDGGITWQGPIRVTSGPGDRWMASCAAYNDQVRVMFLDGSYDFPKRTLYGVTLGSSADGGSTWSFERVDSAPSNPNNSFWFASGASGCPTCTSFIGDYQGIAMDSLGRAHVVWTDMRRDILSPPRKAHDIEYARR